METTTETVVVQTRKANCEWCKWEDYSRCTAEQAEIFLKARRLTPDEQEWRAVDWITKKPLSSVDLDERVDRAYFDGTRKQDQDQAA